VSSPVAGTDRQLGGVTFSEELSIGSRKLPPGERYERRFTYLSGNTWARFDYLAVRLGGDQHEVIRRVFAEGIAGMEAFADACDEGREARNKAREAGGEG